MHRMLIGSRAIIHHFSDFYRKPQDIDYISDDEIDPNLPKYSEGFRFIIDRNPDLDVATPEILYTLKVSHAFFPSVWWKKTMNDICFFQSKKIQFDEELFGILYKDWTKKYGIKSKVGLSCSNEEFFSDAVKRIYVHDDIHKAIAYYEEPLYVKIKKDKSKAMVSYELFNSLIYEDKIRLCREEIYVTALERIVIPKDYRIHSKGAFIEAAELLLTRMSKGWFPKFIVMNWFEIQKFDVNYVSLFKEKLNKGEVRYDDNRA